MYKYSFSYSNLWPYIPVFFFITFGILIIVLIKKRIKNYFFSRQLILFIGYGIVFISSIILITILIKAPSIIREELQKKIVLKIIIF